MNILIINANQALTPVPAMPLGACMAATAALKAGHSVRFLDLMFRRDVRAAVEDEIIRRRPDAVGISLRNIDNNDARSPVAYYRILEQVMESIRAKAHAVTVLGGAAVSIMPEELLRFSGAHCAVIGNGEDVFPQLLGAFSSGGDMRSVPGLGWMERGVFKHNPPPAADRALPCVRPDLDDWLDMAAYRAHFAAVPVQSKRGCPYRCVYCTYGITEGAAYRLSAPEQVAETVAAYADRGYRDLEFVDNVFNAPLEHALQICAELKKQKTRARLQTVELNPAYVTDGLLGAMEEAGFVGAGITAESASDAVLAALGKSYRKADVMRCAETVRRHRLPVFWIFLLGGPGETQESVRETMDFAARHLRRGDTAFFNVGVRIYPGTELERRARAEGLLRQPRAAMLDPVFYISPAVDRAWLFATVSEAVARTMRFIDSSSLRSPLLTPLYRLGSLAGVHPPLWRYTPLVRRGLRLLGADA